ncbi:hypothetical protein F8568_036785 [Actinomadura sp. LD22]|uniref:Uncharacterized protein n=1 Tax=Actinomadura physcomitrii TaxID=2650748 RepID=A0A6I4MSV4_9ACTN|nr:hypothetical protein [Actinomadura physcomitrii]MWA05819.1 hypothetical protein [Actinomadura physcomitrii]
MGPRTGPLVTAVRAALTIAGFVLLTAAAWTLAPAAGLASGGVFCLVTEYLTTPSGRDNDG